MKIKDVERLTQTDRATLYYYEKEGLLSPERTDNGYRIYSEEDLLKIRRIKLLRSLQVSIEDLNALKEGTLSLSAVMEKQLEQLELEEKKSSEAKELCMEIYHRNDTYDSLNPANYLTEKADTFHDSRASWENTMDEVPQVYDPVRRFLGRLLDLSLYTVLWYLILYLALRIDLQNRSMLLLIMDQFMIQGLMLFLEPLFLTQYKTTPGKWILGLSIEKSNGTFLGYHEGFSRTFHVLLEGMGFLVPLVSIFTHVISYNRCTQGEPQPWDKDFAYRIKDRRKYRIVLSALCMIIFIGTLSFIQRSYFMPPHKGNLTVEEFAENFNHYQKIYGMKLNGRKLKPSAAWESPYDYRENYLPSHAVLPPNLTFTMKDGYITAVSFVIDVQNTDFYVYHYNEFMSLIALSLMTPEKNLFKTREIADRMVDYFFWDSSSSFTMSLLGVDIINDVDFEGFEATHNHTMPLHDADTNYYRHTFTVIKKTS